MEPRLAEVASATGEGRGTVAGRSFDRRSMLESPAACEGDSWRQEASRPLPDLRIVFVGMNYAATPRLLEAVAAAHFVVAIFESTGHRGWRRFLSRRPPATPLKRFASGHAIPFRLVDPGQRREVSQFLAEHRPDVVCIVSMAHLLPAEALAVPTLGTINLHPSLLPAYRGADPLFWQIYDGVEEGGVTVHLVDEGEDHGPILNQRRFPLPAGITPDGLEELIAEHGSPALLEAIAALATRGSEGLAPQPEESPTRRARHVARHEARELIDWHHWSIERVWRVLRGTGPLALPPARWRDLGWCPHQIRGFERIPTSGPPGSLERDADGWYLVHAEGRIRVKYAFAPRSWCGQVLPLKGLRYLLRRMFK